VLGRTLEHQFQTCEQFARLAQKNQTLGQAPPLFEQDSPFAAEDDPCMESKLQRRIQRYGWDLAADRYERLWQAQLAPAQCELISQAALSPGERVLDVACGTGLVALQAARAVGSGGRVLGIDISQRMVDAATSCAQQRSLKHVDFQRMDAERIESPDAAFDVVLCALGLMYLPDPEQALREMRRVLRPGGRMVVAVWGEHARCGWAPVLSIVDAEVQSEVCPLFFRLGGRDALARACSDAGFERASIRQCRIESSLAYADADEACDAAFVAGPVALAWSRFNAQVRARVRERYLDAIAPWRCGGGYQVPGEFVIVAARVADHGRP
jgi:ubiquinone/menaquinone biosynthesis C-methylase UbiE